MTTFATHRRRFPDRTRESWGYHDARATRQFSRLPMPLLQASWPAHQRTADVETAAARHFDRAYARGYVAGWLSD